jgi:hypothetical protein
MWKVVKTTTQSVPTFINRCLRKTSDIAHLTAEMAVDEIHSEEGFLCHTATGLLV